MSFERAGWKYDDKTKRYICKERKCESFYRTVELPEEIKTDEVEAELKDGILEVALPKKAPKHKKKANVKQYRNGNVVKNLYSFETSFRQIIFVTLIRKSKGDSMGSLWLGAFVGFLVTLILGWMFPGLGHLIGGFIGGFVAGLIARGGMVKGAFAGFLAGIFGGIIIAILAVIGLVGVGAVTGGILGGFFGFLAGLSVGIIAIILAIFGAIASTIGGLVGGLLAR